MTVTPLGETLLYLIEPVAKVRPVNGRHSQQKRFSKIEVANKRLESERVKMIVIGSLDVDQRERLRIIADEIFKSDLKYENVDFHLVGVYLRTAMSKERLIKEGIWNLISRKSMREGVEDQLYILENWEDQEHGRVRQQEIRKREKRKRYISEKSLMNHWEKTV